MEHAGGGSEEPRGDRWGWKSSLAFLYLWLVVGFATGTLVLIAPAHWITASLRRAGLGAWEDPAMWAVIALFVAGSFLLSLWLHRRGRGARRAGVRLGIPLVATAAAALALWGWADPSRLSAAAGGVEERLAFRSGVEFHFGAYPDRERLQDLADAGFTAVVSLQHPAVVPIEPPGIAAEREAAEEIGITFIHAPMLPWVSENREALETIRNLVESGTGKYYVHCGLGRDRVNVVRAFVERMGGARVRSGPDLVPVRTYADRVAEERYLMERGNIQVLAGDLWLSPWPNPKEGLGKLFGGHVESVMLVMDPSDTEQTAWIQEGRRLFELYGVPLVVVHHRPGAPGGLEDAARRVLELPRPTVVLVPRTRPCTDTGIADDFLAGWHEVGGPSPDRIVPGEGRPDAEGRPLPCETSATPARSPRPSRGRRGRRIPSPGAPDG